MVRERRGDDAGAARANRAGLVRKPDSLPLAFRLATVRSRMPGEDAGPDWRRALILAPDSIASRVGYAKWLLAQGRPDEAWRQAREVARRSPRTTDGWRVIADLARARGARLSEVIARERVFRSTRSAADLSAFLSAVEECPACATRFERLQPALERLAPAVFRELREKGALPTDR